MIEKPFFEIKNTCITHEYFLLVQYNIGALFILLSDNCKRFHWHPQPVFTKYSHKKKPAITGLNQHEISACD